MNLQLERLSSLTHELKLPAVAVNAVDLAKQAGHRATIICKWCG